MGGKGAGQLDKSARPNSRAWMMAIFYEGNDDQWILIFFLFFPGGFMFDLSRSENTRNKTHTHTSTGFSQNVEAPTVI